MNHKIKKLRSTAVTLLLIILFTNAPLTRLTSVTADQPKYGGTLVSALSGDIPHFNIAIIIQTIADLAAGKLFNSLAQRDPNGEIVPDLAQSWEVSHDGLAYTFHLVKNATWHDGKPFTSADVKFSIEDVLYKFHPRGKVAFEALDKVDTPDNYTAIVRMKYSFPAFLSFLGNSFAIMLPKHLYEGTDILNNPYNSNPVGTGPFMFKDYVKADHITFVKNPNYFKKGKPYLDRLVFSIIPDVTSRVAAFEKGEIDYINWYGFPNDQYDRLIKLPGATAMQIPFNPLATVIKMDINLRNPPLNNVKVRQAMAYAINKQEILDKSLFGIGKIANSPIPSSFKWAYNPNVTKYEFSLSMANRLLDEAGYPEGPDGVRFKTSIMYDQALPELAKTSEIIRLQLQAVGIDVTLRPTDGATYQAAMGRWEYDMVPWRAASGPDPSVATAYYWSKNIRKSFGTNTGGYNSSRYDLLYEQASRELDPTKRAQEYYDLQTLAAQELPNFWLIEVGFPIAFKTTFSGLPEGAYGYENMDITWWTKGGEPSPAPAQPPYALYSGIIAAIIIVGVATLLYRRKKTRAT